MQNLELWDRFRPVPNTAIKEIKGGRLKGMSDINPVFRLRQLTEAFGPVGFGWNVKEVDRWKEEYGGEVAVFVKVELTVCIDGKWSQPIEGTGGSKLLGKGQGDGINDEAYKMAQTDAISVATKSLGMAADIYFSKGADYGTKYEVQQKPATAPKPVTKDTLQKIAAALTAEKDKDKFQKLVDGAKKKYALSKEQWAEVKTIMDNLTQQ